MCQSALQLACMSSEYLHFGKAVPRGVFCNENAVLMPVLLFDCLRGSQSCTSGWLLACGRPRRGISLAMW